MPQTEDTPTAGLAALREPFPASQIGKLPRGGTTLDYVGHAAVTARLLEVDPQWHWEPVAFDADGGPLIRYGNKDAELWIELTILGVTRLGVGIVALTSFELSKQLISDAIRNAAMRFGVALDLWSKEDLTPPQMDPSEAETRNELLESFGALPATMKTSVLDRLRKAEVIKRKSAGAIGTLDSAMFDVVRRTLDAAHAAVAKAEVEGEPPSVAAGSPPPGINEDGEVKSTEQLIASIDLLEPNLTPEQLVEWSTWLETEMQDRPFGELSHAELVAVYAHIVAMAEA